MGSLREKTARQTKDTWRRTVEKEIKAMGLMGRGWNGRSGQDWLEAESGGLMLRAELKANQMLVMVKLSFKSHFANLLLSKEDGVKKDPISLKKNKDYFWHLLF